MRSRTSISASRALFSVTSSPACGETRKRSTRGPASVTVNRTGIDAGAPASGNVTCCVLTSVPSSSTSSVTGWPSKPDCDNTTSIIRVVPLSAVFGVVMRPTWMSFGNCSWPTPTVNTGRPSAFNPSSAAPSAVSAVSAPSLTMTNPATGKPASSWRTPDSAAPRRVCDPSNFSSPSVVVRDGADENRKVRTVKRSDSALSTAASGPVNCSLMYAARGWPAWSAICMLRESSSNTPRKFCCATAALTTSSGRKRQIRMTASNAMRMTASAARSRARLRPDR